MMCGALSAAVLLMLLSLTAPLRCSGSHCAAVLRVRWRFRSAAWVCDCGNIAASVSIITKTIIALFQSGFVSACTTAGYMVGLPVSRHITRHRRTSSHFALRRIRAVVPIDGCSHWSQPLPYGASPQCQGAILQAVQRLLWSAAAPVSPSAATACPSTTPGASSGGDVRRVRGRGATGASGGGPQWVFNELPDLQARPTHPP